jgi:hypothetical protein
MAKTAPRAILLRGRHIHEERPAGGTITPGHLVQLNSSGQFVVHATAAVAAVPIFAVENDLVGKGIDDNYVVNDLCQAEHCSPGMEVNALIAAAAPAITKGDLLESAGNGTLRKVVAGIALARSNETVDNSAGGAAVRLQVTIL